MGSDGTTTQQNSVMERVHFRAVARLRVQVAHLRGESRSLQECVYRHSALMHGRRAMPGGDPSKPRYFIDVVSVRTHLWPFHKNHRSDKWSLSWAGSMLVTLQSYCQPGPRRWPNYGRGYETQREINTICMEHGCDRGGRYAHLFDPELPLFYDRDADDARGIYDSH